MGLEGRFRVVFRFACLDASLIEGMARDALLNVYLPSGDCPTRTII